jgi:hypothetical protein
MLEGLVKPLISTAIFCPSFSAVKILAAAKSISSSTRSMRTINGSLLIVHPSLIQAVFTD